MPRPITTLFKLAPLACACLLIAGTRARAQEQPQMPSASFTAEFTHGVELYKRGDYENAVKVLKKAAGRKEDDPDAWHFLGLTYSKLGKSKDALKAFEKAVALSFQPLVPKPSPPGEVYEKISTEEKLSRRLKLASNLQRAADIVEDYLTLQPPGAGFWLTQLESLRFHAQQSAKLADQASVFMSTQVEKRAQVLDHPEPLPTERAMVHGVTGTIAIRFVLAADGTVQHILVLTFLPDGLTDKAVEAARAIKFIPAMKDGHPVSQFAAIMYNFSSH